MFKKSLFIVYVLYRIRCFREITLLIKILLQLTVLQWRHIHSFFEVSAKKGGATKI